MLSLYGLFFIVGGTFVLFAAVAGLDGPDFELEFDPDIETLAPKNEEEETLSVRGKRPRRRLWLPFLSLRFWTFGSCFFGLTGILLTLFQGSIAEPIVLWLAIAVGLLFGTTITAILHNLRQNQANSLVNSNDLIGLPGIVEIPFDSNSKGKIRVSVRGSILDLIALTEDRQMFQPGEQVYIVGMENNKVWVVSQNTLGNYE
ncbi:NfeD family protein [Lusitaniella coriacea LEGE 07157]|uniref:NfeD family protein n=1 Tax=Lusitaniella coriacea LEGE 07157 TaxID=945747 RepID=A0A8J7DVQ4_9CYAN|nr:NfeD family protein [Lusitaniella coriacea]MBE9115974.1 NfeD family protein [Lusitaniella coriacea LEGE 07157]